MKTRPEVVVSGFVTSDYVLQTDEALCSGGPAVRTVRRIAWPRPGGAVLYAGRRLAEHGALVAAVTWLGVDSDGWRFRRELQHAGLSVHGVETLDHQDTPVCIFALHDDTESVCLVDAAIAQDVALTGRQAALVRRADVLCMATGPARSTAQLLECISPDAQVAWIQKHDSRSFHAELRQALYTRANFIFCNSGERRLSGEGAEHPRRGQVVVETMGRDGVRIHHEGKVEHLRGRVVECIDTVGAGDTFAGETLACILCHGASLRAAAERGMTATEELLEKRALLASERLQADPARSRA